MNRQLLATALLALLAATAGCTGFLGSGGISDQKLGREASYEWDAATTDVRINVTGGEYRAMYTFSNWSLLSVFQRDSLGDKQPVAVSAVQFRYSNGTVVDHSHIIIDKRDSRTVISPPAENGTLAYTAPARGHSFKLPTFVDDVSYEVVLPAGMRVDNFVLSKVRPSGYVTDRLDDRVHLRWEAVSADAITVRYYRGRDLTIFTGVLGALAVCTMIGLAYFRLQISRLEKQREELGLNVDVTDDDSGGGPPGLG